LTECPRVCGPVHPSRVPFYLSQAALSAPALCGAGKPCCRRHRRGFDGPLRRSQFRCGRGTDGSVIQRGDNSNRQPCGKRRRRSATSARKRGAGRRAEASLPRPERAAAVFRFSRRRCAWSGWGRHGPLMSGRRAPQQRRLRPRRRPNSPKGSGRQTNRRHRRIIRTNVAAAQPPGVKPGSPVGQHAVHLANTVARASCAISGERLPLNRSCAGGVETRFARLWIAQG